MLNCRSQWPSGLRRKSTAARLAGVVGSNPTGGTDVCRECCVLSGGGLLDEPITRPEGVLPSVMRRRVWSTNLALPSHLWLRLNTRCITGCISYMPLIVTVNMIAECLLTDCNILGENKKKMLSCVIVAIGISHRVRNYKLWYIIQVFILFWHMICKNASGRARHSFCQVGSTHSARALHGSIV